MRSGRVIFSAAVLLGIAACKPAETQPATLADVITSRSDSTLGSLEVMVPTGTIRTVDTLEVQITLSLAPGVALESLTFEPESHGWSVVHESIETPSLSPASMMVHRRRYVLEPFLAHDYVVPAAAARLRSADSHAFLETAEQLVRVESILTEGDHELTPPRPLIAHGSAEAARVPLAWFALGGSVVAAAILGAVIYSRRMRSPAIHVLEPSSLRNPELSDREFARAALAMVARSIGPESAVPVKAMTSDELMQLMERSHPPHEIISCLPLFDAVLYADAQIDPEQRVVISGAIEKFLATRQEAAT